MMGDETHDSAAPLPASSEGWVKFHLSRDAARQAAIAKSPTPAPRRLLVYVSGPMTGLPFLNYPAFISAGLQLTGAGFGVVNPAALDHSRHDGSWAAHMRVDIAALMHCDGVALLPGWEQSKGACVEVDLARTLGMDVREMGGWLRHPLAGALDAAMAALDAPASPLLRGLGDAVLRAGGADGEGGEL